MNKNYRLCWLYFNTVFMKEANRETENYANYVAPESLQWHNKGK